MKNSKKQKLDIVLLVLFPFIAIAVSLIFKTNFLISTLLFFGLPSIYLSYKNQKAIKKTLLFTFIISVPLSILIDYIAVINNSWYVPTSFFPFRFLGVIPIEDFIWGYGLAYTVIIFYEHFFDKTGREIIDKRMQYFGWLFGILLLLFFAILFLNPALLNIKYAYFWLGLTLVLLPAVTFLTFFPRMLSKYLKTGVYFFLLTLLLELTGLHLDQWRFPGTYFIGWVELFGYRFPFEEFFFFIMITAMAILSYYEFFDDDRK